MTITFFFKPHIGRRKLSGKPHYLTTHEEDRRKIREKLKLSELSKINELKIQQAEEAIKNINGYDLNMAVSGELTTQILNYLEALEQFQAAEKIQDKINELAHKQELLAIANRILMMQEEEEYALLLLLH